MVRDALPTATAAIRIDVRVGVNLAAIAPVVVAIRPSGLAGVCTDASNALGDRIGPTLAISHGVAAGSIGKTCKEQHEASE